MVQRRDPADLRLEGWVTHDLNLERGLDGAGVQVVTITSRS
jgi:hypothetical protein